MTTLAAAVDADANPHHASVMDAEGPPPPSPPSPPLTSAPAPLLHNLTTHFPSSSQQSAPSQPESSPDINTQPKSLDISTSEVASPSTNNHNDNNHTPTLFNHDDSTTSPSSAISSQAESQATGSTDLLDRKPLHVVENLKTEAGHEQRSLSTSQSPEPTSLSGTKRTATGQLKRSSVNGLGDVVANANANATGHARSSSTISNGSYSNGNVVEVNEPFHLPASPLN